MVFGYALLQLVILEMLWLWFSYDLVIYWRRHGSRLSHAILPGSLTILFIRIISRHLLHAVSIELTLD
jgi:hypothetical protein